MLTQHLAKELGPRKIAANVVAPGAIETDFTAAALAHPGVKEMITSQTALNRIGVPDDIGVVAFLCSKRPLDQRAAIKRRAGYFF